MAPCSFRLPPTSASGFAGHLSDPERRCARGAGVTGGQGPRGLGTADAMVRVGHSGPAVALRCQHVTEDRTTAIAAALSEPVQPAAVASISV